MLHVGIGRCTALELARNGAHVILACRTANRALPTVESIKAETKNPYVEFMELDLSSLQSIQSFVDAFLAKKLALHLLINNAGIMALSEFQLSKDGVEMQFATNHLGHFLLTMRLLPLLIQNQPSRIVNLASSAHNFAFKCGILPPDQLNDPKCYSAWQCYGQSKLANILFTRELSTRLEALGHKKLFVNAVHPGVVSTELGRSTGLVSGFLIRTLGPLFLLTPLKGALTSLFVATDPSIEAKEINGAYFVPIAKQQESSVQSQDASLAKSLWDLSLALLKEKSIAIEFLVWNRRWYDFLFETRQTFTSKDCEINFMVFCRCFHIFKMTTGVQRCHWCPTRTLNN